MSDDFDPTTVSWVLTEDDFPFFVEAMSTCPDPVYDLETTGLDEYAYSGGPKNGGVAARVVMISATLPQPGMDGPPTTWVMPLSHPDSPFLGVWRARFGTIMQTVVDEDGEVTGHNVKFDNRWTFATTGVDLSRNTGWCTKVSSHLLDENSSTKLKERAPATFGVERWDDHDLSYPGAAEDVPMFELGIYAARDTYWTWRLRESHRERMCLTPGAEEPQTPDEVEEARMGTLATWISMPTTATLSAIEQRGIRLDIEWCERTLAEDQAAYERLGRELADLYEETRGQSYSFAPTATWFARWAEVAMEHGDLIVSALTPTGKPQWSRSVLAKQARDGSTVADNLLEYRRLSKRCEFLRSWLASRSEDERIHANYNDGSVSTGRLSSSGPNMQQVTAALKAAFVPSEGFYLGEFDFSQIEMRIAAQVSNCVPMIEAFRRGDDLHKLLALQIIQRREVISAHAAGRPVQKLTVADVKPYERQAGKSANFGLLYGMGAMGFMIYAEEVYGVRFTVDEAFEVHRLFFETWDGLAQWHADTAVKVGREGQVVSPLGRVRRLYNARIRDEGGAERAGINSPVQGTASDLMQMAASWVEGTLPGYEGVPGARIVGTVHDSILVELPIETWRETAREVQYRMEHVGEPLEKHLHVSLVVPLVADYKVGTRWGAKDIYDSETGDAAA